MVRLGVAFATLLVLCVLGAAFFGWFCLEAEEVATLQPGEMTLTSPSGQAIYLRRQSIWDQPAELYLSATQDYYLHVGPVPGQVKIYVNETP